MGSLFTNKSQQSTTQNSSQQGTTQNNLWDDPNLQQFMQGYNQQFSNFGGANIPLNQYQTGAADNQQALAGSATLQPAFNAANAIAGQGISPSAIQAFQNPYENQVVGNLIEDFNTQNQQTLDGNRGRRAAQGALGNQTGADALIMQGQQDAQAKQLAQTRQQGFNTAAGLAGQSAGLQLQGAGQAGALTGAGTQANAALGSTLGTGSIYQPQYQSALSPYTTANLGIQGYQGLGNLAGTNYSSTSQGTSTGTKSETPSIGSIMAGLAGSAMMAYSDERIKENIKPIGETFDGQPIYKYNLAGSPKTEIGLMAQDVEQRDPSAVGEIGGIKTVDYDRATRPAEKAEGGSVFGSPAPAAGTSTFADKVVAASQALRQMKESAANGGAIKGYNAGGAPYGEAQWGPHSAEWAQPGPGETDAALQPWTATVTPEPQGPNAWNKMGSGLSGMADKMGPQSGGDLGTSRMLSDAQNSMTQMMGQMRQRPYGGRVLDEAEGPAMPTWDREGAPVFGDSEPSSLGPSYVGAAAGPGPESDAPPPEAPPAAGGGIGSLFSGWRAPFSTGMWKGEKADPWQRAGAAISMIGSGPFAPMGKAALEQQGINLRELQQAEDARHRADVLLGRINGQDTLAARQLASQEAARLAQQSHQAAVLKHQEDELAERRRVNDPTVGINEQKLEELKDPTKAFDRREALADRLGLERGSRERAEYVATGDFPRLGATVQTEDMKAAARKKAVIEQGGNPEDAATKQYILTGKFPREDQAPMTATDKKIISESEDLALSGSEAILALREAIKLNDKTNTGVAAGVRAWAGDSLHDYMVPDFIASPESAAATLNFNNLVLGQALAGLKATFGAAPTEGERKILLELQASADKSPPVRADIMKRAIALAERKIKHHNSRVDELRGGTYYKPSTTRQRTGATAAPIAQMGLDELKALDRKSMSPEELAEAARRYNELTQGAPRP